MGLARLSRQTPFAAVDCAYPRFGSYVFARSGGNGELRRCRYLWRRSFGRKYRDVERSRSFRFADLSRQRLFSAIHLGNSTRKQWSLVESELRILVLHSISGDSAVVPPRSRVIHAAFERRSLRGVAVLSPYRDFDVFPDLGVGRDCRCDQQAISELKGRGNAGSPAWTRFSGGMFDGNPTSAVRTLGLCVGTVCLACGSCCHSLRRSRVNWGFSKPSKLHPNSSGFFVYALSLPLAFSGLCPCRDGFATAMGTWVCFSYLRTRHFRSMSRLLLRHLAVNGSQYNAIARAHPEKNGSCRVKSTRRDKPFLFFFR